MITGYRDHGHMLACGMDPKGVMAELTGRRGGYSKGKGGSMHMFSDEKDFYGGHGIVGAQVSLGTGLAFANRYRGNGKVCLTYFGDGAANQGQVYESFNMAELWKLPVVYVIENNQLRHGHRRSSARRPQTDLSKRGVVLQHPRRAGRRHGRARRARRRRQGGRTWCRDGKGPYILEMKTYRYRGHSMSDPAKYRTREEVDEDAQRARPDRAGAGAARSRPSAPTEDDAEGRSTPRCAQIVDRRRRVRHRTTPEPDPSELWTDIVR